MAYFSLVPRPHHPATVPPIQLIVYDELHQNSFFSASDDSCFTLHLVLVKSECALIQLKDCQPINEQFKFCSLIGAICSMHESEAGKALVLFPDSQFSYHAGLGMRLGRSGNETGKVWG